MRRVREVLVPVLLQTARQILEDPTGTRRSWGYLPQTYVHLVKYR